MRIHGLWIAAALGFLWVSLGAFGSHALREKISSDSLEIYKTAILYGMFHTLAILGVTLILIHHPLEGFTKVLNFSLISFTVGIVLFSGSLITLALTQIRSIGWITPIGGLFLLNGWLLFLIASIRFRGLF